MRPEFSGLEKVGADDKLITVLSRHGALNNGGPSMNYTPACDIDKPANSMSWSREKAPILMRSLSRAAAFFADRV
jgi:hypothetical protein